MIRALLAVLALGSVLGCGGPRFPSSVVLEDPLLEREWRASLFVPPARTKSQQRAVLARAGAEIDCSILMQARRPDHVQVVGLDDLGGTMFHVLRTAEGTQVIQGSPILADDFLVNTLVEGLALVFIGVPSADLRLVRLESGALALHGAFGLGEALFVREGAGAVEPDRFEIGQRGRLRASIRILEWSRDQGGRVLFPGRFLLSDAAGRCRLEIRVIEWRTEAAS